MARKKRNQFILEEQGGRLQDLDSLPNSAALLPKVLEDAFGISAPDVSDAIGFRERIASIPEEELRGQLERFRSKWDPAEFVLISECVQCATAINRHDSLFVGDRFERIDRFEPIPPIWVTGEPNTGRRQTVNLILNMCSDRILERSKSFDCECDDEQLLVKRLFGSYFDGIDMGRGHTPAIIDMDAGFLLFYRAEKLSMKLQQRLVKWRENRVQRSMLEWSARTSNYDLRTLDKFDDNKLVSDPREEIELSDVAVFFVADRPPWELVNEGLIMRDLISGSVHIPVPALRDCPKLIQKKLCSLIVNKPTLTDRVSNPLNYWSNGALEMVYSFEWPDNTAGLKGLVDNLYFKGYLRSRKDIITETHVRNAL